jgi:hypothetical protein
MDSNTNLEAAARREARLEGLLERTRRQNGLLNGTTTHRVRFTVGTARTRATRTRALGRRLAEATRLFGLTAAVRIRVTRLGATALLTTARLCLRVARLARLALLALAGLENRGLRRTRNERRLHNGSNLTRGDRRLDLTRRHLRNDFRDRATNDDLITTLHRVRTALGTARARATRTRALGGRLAEATRLAGLVAALRVRVTDLGATAQLATALAILTGRLARGTLFASFERGHLLVGTCPSDKMHVSQTSKMFPQARRIEASNIRIRALIA